MTGLHGSRARWLCNLHKNPVLVEDFHRAVATAIDEGWATVAAPLEFSEPVVSRVMDGVQRYIANADDRPADEVERADAALAALAAQYLSAGTATEVYIYTTDIAAGEGAETVLASEGYGDSVTFVNGFRFIEDLVAGDS